MSDDAATPRTPSRPPLSTIGGFEVLRALGQGAQGVVYLARQPALDRLVGLKVLHRTAALDEEMVLRFRREARAAAGLGHPHIVPIHDFGEDADTFYIAMMYVPAGSLRGLLKTRMRISPGEAAGLGDQVARALAFAHVRGIVHRDVKPSNILLDEQGNSLLADFGIAQLSHATRLTGIAGGPGTAEYMAPELARGATASPESDQYALAVTLFEALAGYPPFTGEDPIAVAAQHRFDPIPPLPADVPAPLGEVVMRALSKEPAERFPGAEAMARALREAVRVEPVELAAQEAVAPDDALTRSSWPPSPAAPVKPPDATPSIPPAERFTGTVLRRERPAAEPAPLADLGVSRARMVRGPRPGNAARAAGRLAARALVPLRLIAVALAALGRGLASGARVAGRAATQGLSGLARGFRRLARAWKPIAATAGAVAVLASAVVYLVTREVPPAVTFPKITLASGLVVERSWKAAGTALDAIEGTVRLRADAGSAAARASAVDFVEVLPADLVSRMKSIRFRPKETSVLERGRAYYFRLDLSKTAEIRYILTLEAGGLRQPVLSAWARALSATPTPPPPPPPPPPPVRARTFVSGKHFSLGTPRYADGVGAQPGRSHGFAFDRDLATYWSIRGSSPVGTVIAARFADVVKISGIRLNPDRRQFGAFRRVSAVRLDFYNGSKLVRRLSYSGLGTSPSGDDHDFTVNAREVRIVLTGTTGPSRFTLISEITLFGCSDPKPKCVRAR